MDTRKNYDCVYSLLSKSSAATAAASFAEFAPTYATSAASLRTKRSFVLLLVGLFLCLHQILTHLVIHRQYQSSSVRHEAALTSSDASLATIAALSSTPRPQRPRIRVLHGIFTTDWDREVGYRKRHRDLFSVWNDSRVCTLHAFRQMSNQERDDSPCELIYTFVLGRSASMEFAGLRNVSESAAASVIDAMVNSTNTNAMSTTKESFAPYSELPTLLLERDSVLFGPIEVAARPIVGLVSGDLTSAANNSDFVVLNIRDNMNDGKSPTWLYFASQLAAQYGFDYVAKCDSDAILSLHDYFDFVYNYPLAPAPYNSMTLIGGPVGKHNWRKDRVNRAQERYFNKNYNMVHIYSAGQLYTLSSDLAAAVANEARVQQQRREQNKDTACTYCGGHEDHDVGTLAFHVTGGRDEDNPQPPPETNPPPTIDSNSTTSSMAASAIAKDTAPKTTGKSPPRPIRFIILGTQHFYWTHPIKKNNAPFERLLAREQARMAGEAMFDGQALRVTPPQQAQ